MERLERGLRYAEGASDAIDEFLTQVGLPLVAQEALFGQAVVPQKRVEAIAIELAPRTRKGGVVDDSLADLRFGDGEPELVRLDIEDRVGHEA